MGVGDSNGEDSVFPDWAIGFGDWQVVLCESKLDIMLAGCEHDADFRLLADTTGVLGLASHSEQYMGAD